MEEPRGHLRRELRFWEAIAISIGIMAPTAAMALNGVAPAGLVGRAVPLAFLFAAIAIALISYAFVRLTHFFNHAGSSLEDWEMPPAEPARLRMRWRS
jgi:amino acid transporter